MRIPITDEAKAKQKEIWKKRAPIIKELRKRKGLSQSSVAEILGITDRQYSLYYENGNGPIPDDKIYTLCTLFNTTPSILLGYETIRVTDINSTTQALKEANIRFKDDRKQITIPINQFDESDKFGISFPKIWFSDKKRQELKEMVFHMDYDDLIDCVESAQNQASNEIKSVWQALFSVKFKSHLFKKLEDKALNQLFNEFKEWKQFLISRKENENGKE